jgi:hypothetical protein
MSRRNIAIVAALIASGAARGAELKQETLDAWDRYLHAADAHMQDRVGNRFLWIDESPARLSRVHAGEVAVEPMNNAPEKVPSGLIHHWIGAAFIPGARMDDVVAVVRNYDRYTEFYKPSVIDARTLSHKADEDRF